MADVQARLQIVSAEFQKHQQDLQNVIQSRQKLEAQRQENLGVQKEFTKLKDDEVVYKLIGPVLLKQDRSEAESTVNGRIEFIGKETSRLERQIKETQDKIEKLKVELIQIRAAAETAGSGAGAGPGAGTKSVTA